MLSNNLTICIFCFNEEARIEQTILNFHNKFPILIVDDITPSTDQTIPICEKYNLKHINLDRHNFSLNSTTMSELWSHVKTDYLLIASCSEYLPLPVLNTYAEVANTNSHDIIRLTRISITAGKFISTWGNARTEIIRAPLQRFSKRNSIDYTDNPIHKEGKPLCPPSRILTLPRNLHFYQFRDYDASWSDIQHCRYADIEAHQLHKSNKKYSFLFMFFKSIIFFLRDYFYNKSFLQGHLGFMHCYYRFHLSMSIYLRLWDLEHNMTKSDIINIHQSLRKKLLTNEISPKDLFKR